MFDPGILAVQIWESAQFGPLPPKLGRLELLFADRIGDDTRLCNPGSPLGRNPKASRLARLR